MENHISSTAIFQTESAGLFPSLDTGYDDPDWKAVRSSTGKEYEKDLYYPAHQRHALELHRHGPGVGLHAVQGFYSTGANGEKRESGRMKHWNISKLE
jgi:hypothetical protein